MCGLIMIFPFQGMSRISASPVLLKSGILSVLEYLTHHAALMAANALVGSRLDYCNSLFRSLSALDLCKLQCVQNCLARIVTSTTKYSHISPVRKTLHWLPIEHGFIFKTALLVYKFLRTGYAKYFAPFLKPRHT